MENVLSKKDARKIILHAAGLAKRAQFGKGIEAAYKLIDHVGFIQVDTNYVVERAHHHSIFSRVPDYKPEWLDQLQAEGRVFEYWTYASGYMPMHDFRFSLPIKESFKSRWKLAKADSYLMEKILDRIAREGPMRAKDFEDERQVKKSQWWDWRPSKVALERLYMGGQLMFTRDGDFRKVFDLTENSIPTDTDTTPPSTTEFARHIVERSLKALGIADAFDIGLRARYVGRNLIKEELKKMVEEGEVCEVAVEEVKGRPLYMLPLYRKKKVSVKEDVFILSPFDVLCVHRNRLKNFFDFDYMVECFVPEPKRKYGYFALPVLVGDTFVARMDAKADRANKKLIIHNLHFESKEIPKPTMEKIAEVISSFARFNGCVSIELKKSNVKSIRSLRHQIDARH